MTESDKMPADGVASLFKALNTKEIAKETHHKDAAASFAKQLEASANKLKVSDLWSS